MVKRFIISEKQEKYLSSSLKEDVYKEPSPQNPSIKKANKPYCINPDNVLLVKKFLDNGFTKHDWEKVGANGLPMKVKIFSMNASNGEPLKWLYQDQLHDLLVDRFQNMFSDHDERDLFMKQVLKDWVNDSIGVHGNLTSNYLMENSINEITYSDLTSEANKADTNPTEAQKEAGNYMMGHVSVKGMRISIESPRGSYRVYKDNEGKLGKNLMKHHYGYFNVTKGKDGDAVDCFLGPNIENFNTVYCIDQKNESGEFDETKVMLGFDSKDEAKKAYLSNYSPDWRGFMKITAVSLKTFKKWLYRGRKQRQPFAEYVYIQKNKLKESKFHDLENDFTLNRFEEWERVRNKHGMMNLKNIETNDYLSDVWFDWIGYMVNGIAIVMKDGKYNLIDDNGKIILSKWYDDVWDCDDGSFEVIDGEDEKNITINESNLKAALAGGLLALSPMAANANNVPQTADTNNSHYEFSNNKNNTIDFENELSSTVGVHCRKKIETENGTRQLISLIVKGVGKDKQEASSDATKTMIMWLDENNFDIDTFELYKNPKLLGYGTTKINGEITESIEINFTVLCSEK